MNTNKLHKAHLQISAGFAHWATQLNDLQRSGEFVGTGGPYAIPKLLDEQRFTVLDRTMAHFDDIEDTSRKAP